MVLSNMKKLAVLAAAFGFMTAADAMAADLTDVLDAADEVYLGTEKVSDPFDISLTPKFVQRHEWAKLKREAVETNGSQHLYNELKYERVINQIDLDLEIGMWHDLAFRMNMPIVVSDQRSYKFDKDIHIYNSWFSTQYGKTPGRCLDEFGQMQDNCINPNAYNFFNLNDGETLKGKKRSGIGDISFGIAWSPYNTERHFIPERPWERNTGRSTITLGFDYVAPTGKFTQIDNDTVGSGTHQVIFSVAASHRFPIVDPYIRLQYGIPVGLESAYKDFGDNQKRQDPGMWGRIDLGIEFLPYESFNIDYQRLVKIDLRGYFKYNGEGRVYSELADAFAKGDCYSTTMTGGAVMDAKCGWVAEKWSNAGKDNIIAMSNGTYSGTIKEDGIFDYEGFATVGGALNLTIQPIQYVAIIAGVAADYTQNHFITFTKVGKDRGTANEAGTALINNTKDGIVSDSVFDERNPAFSTALDRAGQRIKRTESFNLEWFAGVRVMY